MEEKLDSTGSYQVENEKAVVFYKLTLIIVKDKKPHITGESFIKICLLTACSTFLWEESYNKIAKILLSNDSKI